MPKAIKKMIKGNIKKASDKKLAKKVQVQAVEHLKKAKCHLLITDKACSLQGNGRELALAFTTAMSQDDDLFRLVMDCAQMAVTYKLKKAILE